MLQQDKAEDFVVATGTTTYIRDFLRVAFTEVWIELEFNGTGEAEEGIVVNNGGNGSVKIGQKMVKVAPRYYRLTELNLLIGDPTKAKTKLGWNPNYTLASMLKGMVSYDIELFKKEQILKESGYQIKN